MSVSQMNPTQPSAVEDELYFPVGPTRYQAQNVFLSDAERAAGCEVYRVPNSALAPYQQAGDYVVVRPLERNYWGEPKFGNVCLLLVQYEADEWLQEFKANHFMRVLHNSIEDGGPIVGFEDDDDSEAVPTQRRARTILEMWVVVRLTRNYGAWDEKGPFEHLYREAS
ncbi:hypothetical protein [Hymenobacter sp. GOD-10R]|uniref:hypothetical protein n=1 Tax=Hymenobacter sp. GOD-10R TaxID=3093922 RepID=UPI002D7896A5|nr:hypothetical protein [Hymenobacter sp. GOD-10R]WRQ29368.1 hypothetical protein SD425_03705 [Hymenobacter sp. GOD-10R]